MFSKGNTKEESKNSPNSRNKRQMDRKIEKS